MLPYFLPTIYLISFLLFVFLANLVIDYFMLRSFVGPRYRLFLAPGIIIHELSHAFAAKLCGCRITNFNITSPDGGFVVHTQPKFKLLQVLISLAPIFGLSLSLILTAKILAPSLLQPITSTTLDLNETFSSIHFNWQTLLFLILTVSFSGSLAPSKQDFKVTFPGLIYLSIILILASFSPLGLILNKAGHSLAKSAAIITIFLLFGIILSYIMFIITPFLKPKRSKQHRG